MVLDPNSEANASNIGGGIDTPSNEKIADQQAVRVPFPDQIGWLHDSDNSQIEIVQPSSINLPSMKATSPSPDLEKSNKPFD